MTPSVAGALTCGSACPSRVTRYRARSSASGAKLGAVRMMASLAYCLGTLQGQVSRTDSEEAAPWYTAVEDDAEEEVEQARYMSHAVQVSDETYEGNRVARPPARHDDGGAG